MTSWTIRIGFNQAPNTEQASRGLYGYIGVPANLSTTGTVQQYVGANGANVNYFTPEMPFLNIFKQAGNNGAGGGSPGAYTGWFTATSGSGETNEENYLQLDSDGYLTTM